MKRMWRMFRLVRFIQEWEKYLETKSEKNWLEIRKGRMEVTVVTSSFAQKFGYTDWIALDILNACEAEGLVQVEVAHIDQKTKNELRVVTITPRDGQDYATWSGFAEYILMRRAKLVAFLIGLITSGIIIGLYKLLRAILHL